MADVNPRVVEGDNSLSRAVQIFDLCGFLLAQREVMAEAMQDTRLDRACLRVLGILVTTLDRDSRTSWVGRRAIAEATAITEKSVSNYIYQLKQLGYIVSERRATPQADNRVLMHYAVSKLDPAELERQIEMALLSLKGERDPLVRFPSPREVSSRPDRNLTSRSDRNACSRPDRKSSAVPVMAGTQVPAPAGSRVPVASAKSDPASAEKVAKTSVNSDASGEFPSGRAQYNTNNTSLASSSFKTETVEFVERGVRGESAQTSALPLAGREGAPAPVVTPEPAAKPKRGTRLPENWFLPKAWGEWARENFRITDDQIRREAESFKDYWLGRTGQIAVKADWFATWRNWLRKGYGKFERPKAASDAVAPSPPKFDAAKHFRAAMEAEGADFRPGDE